MLPQREQPTSVPPLDRATRPPSSNEILCCAWPAPPPPPPGVLELRDLSKHYPTHRAVDSVSLRIQRGEFFSLLGPSGCGKTTTLRMIAGFEDPTSGEIRLNGAGIQHLKPYQRNVSTVFQNYALFPHLTVRENVEFGLRRRGDNNIARACGRRTRPRPALGQRIAPSF